MRLHESRAARRPIHILERELLDSHDAGRLLGVSKFTVSTWDKDGLMPSPVRIGPGVVRWRRRELQDWVAAFCPHRCDWTWRPSVPAKIDALLKQRTEEAAELEKEISDLKSRRAAGEVRVPLAAA